jgi:hypothetical protein
LPNEPHNAHLLRFIATTVAASLLIGLPLLVAGLSASSVFVLNLVTVLVASVPAWSMLAAAVGASVRRKLRYMLGLLVFVVVFDLVAFVTGWQQMATTATVIDSVRSEVLVAAYQLVLVSSPVVALVIFAGKRPSVFWSTD